MTKELFDRERSGMLRDRFGCEAPARWFGAMPSPAEVQSVLNRLKSGLGAGCEVGAFDDGSEEFKSAVTHAFRSGDYSLAPALAAYAKADPQVRRVAIEVLSQAPPGERWRMLELAAATGSPEVLPPLREALSMLWGTREEHEISEELALRAALYAARFFELSADAGALDMLTRLTRHPSRLVRHQVCYAASCLVGRVPEPHALREFVRAAFRSDDADLRSAVVPHAAVELMGVEECLEVAESILLEASAELWWDSACKLLTAVARTMLTGTRERVARLSSLWLGKHTPRRGWLTIVELLVECEDFERVEPFLQTALRQESPFERWYATELLRRVPHPRRKALANEALADEPEPLLQRRLEAVLLELEIDG